MKKVHLNKRQIAKILVAILCIAGLSSFLVYYFTPQPLVPLTEEQEIQLKEWCVEDAYPAGGITVEDIYIRSYYGTYNNCIVARVSRKNVDGTITYDNSRIVAGCKFVGTTICVYRNGELASLKGAYEEGWLSFKDVKDIHYYYSN